MKNLINVAATAAIETATNVSQQSNDQTNWFLVVLLSLVGVAIIAVLFRWAIRSSEIDAEEEQQECTECEEEYSPCDIPVPVEETKTVIPTQVEPVAFTPAEPQIEEAKEATVVEIPVPVEEPKKPVQKAPARFEVTAGTMVQTSDGRVLSCQLQAENNAIWCKPNGDEGTLNLVNMADIVRCTAEKYLAIRENGRIVEIAETAVSIYDAETYTLLSSMKPVSEIAKFGVPTGTVVKKAGKAAGTFFSYDEDNFIVRNKNGSYPVVKLTGDPISVGDWQLSKMPERELMLAVCQVTGESCILDMAWNIVMK